MDNPLTSGRRRVVAAVVGVAALAGGTAAVAATQNSATAESQAVIADAAARVGVSPTKLTSALQQALIDRIDAAVKAGTVTKVQADRMKADIRSGTISIFEGAGRGEHGHHRGPGGHIDDAAATFLGITAQQLGTELDAGKTLAQVTTAHGKAVAELKVAITAAVTKDLDTAVAAGSITAAEKKQELAGLSAHLDQEINEVHAAGQGGPDGAEGAGA